MLTKRNGKKLKFTSKFNIKKAEYNSSNKHKIHNQREKNQKMLEMLEMLYSKGEFDY